MTDEAPKPDWWARTIGGAQDADPRDGETHACFGKVRDRIDVEAWAHSADQTDWRYVRDDLAAIDDKDGRPVHTFRFESRV